MKKGRKSEKLVDILLNKRYVKYLKRRIKKRGENYEYLRYCFTEEKLHILYPVTPEDMKKIHREIVVLFS